MTPAQAYVFEILGDIVTSTPESAALFAPQGHVLRAGDTVRQPELAERFEAAIVGVCFSRDGKVLYSVDALENVFRWDTSDPDRKPRRDLQALLLC